MLRAAPVVQVLSPVIAIFGVAMLLPLAVSHVLADSATTAYDFAVAFTITTGAVLWLATRRIRAELEFHHGYLLVALIWTVLPAFAALPLLVGIPGLSFTDAYFETASAMSTTGATVLVGLDQLPASLNLWRAMLQWLGGMGVVVLAVAILPLLGIGGRQMFRAETPGPMKDQALTPRIAQTAKGLWTVYAALTLLCALAYWAAGMGALDALIHAFTTLPLGGYSSHDASFAYFDSAALETVAVFFMLIAGVNFGTHFLAFRGRSLAPYRNDPEVLAFFLVLLASCWGIAAFLRISGAYPDLLTAARFATFNVVSIATTTGYASTDYNQWPIFAPVLMLFLCGFTTCAGSTGSGIKMVRAVILVKQARREMTRILHPRAVNPVILGGQPVENKVIFAVLAFMLVYGASITGLTFVLLLAGLDVISAFSAIVACVNNTGPGLNLVGPATTYANLNDFEIWVCTFAMLIGRLELFSVLVLFTPEFWRR